MGADSVRPTRDHGDQHEIVVSSRRLYTAATVRTWHETGLLFADVKPRHEACSQIVIHWTGAENPPAAVHRNMSAEGLSVHFVIDQFGIVWQMADANGLCAHASGVNVRSVGVEMINRGNDRNVPTRGVERSVQTERIHGKPCVYAGFTLEQQVACVALVSTLCEAYKLPMRVPMEAGKVRASALDPNELRTFRGVIGHLHAQSGGKVKCDPGLRMLELVHLHGLGAA